MAKVNMWRLMTLIDLRVRYRSIRHDVRVLEKLLEHIENEIRIKEQAGEDE